MVAARAVSEGVGGRGHRWVSGVPCRRYHWGVDHTNVVFPNCSVCRLLYALLVVRVVVHVVVQTRLVVFVVITWASNNLAGW